MEFDPAQVSMDPPYWKIWKTELRCCSSVAKSCPTQWCHLTISSSVTPFSSLLSIFPSSRVFSNESAVRNRQPKYWHFSFSISPSHEYSGLIYLKIDWFDLLAVQGTFRSLLQYHSSKASILLQSAFFMVQLSWPYVTTGKTKPWLYRTLSAE